MRPHPTLLALILACAIAPAAAHDVVVSAPSKAVAKAAAIETRTGLVTAVTLDNRVTGSTTRVSILYADDGSRSVLQGAAAATLQPGAGYAVTGRAHGRAFDVESAVPSNTTPTRAGSLAALPRFEMSGTFRLAFADDFDGNASEAFYALVDDTRQVRLDLAALFGGLASGMTGTVTGKLDPSGDLFVDRIVILGGAPARKPPSDEANASPVTTSYIVIPVKFPTNASAPYTYAADPFTPASINTAMFGASPNSSVTRYYEEASFGQQALSGIVADNGSGGWLLADRATPTSCDISAIASAAEAAATARGYNLPSYAGRMYVFSNNVPGCSWAGLAYIGWARAYIKQTTNLLVLGHEIGHNFGMYHAASLDCGANVIGGTCTSSEYGEPFGIMGNQRAMHFSSPQKLELGWITPGSVKTHTAGRQTYTLTPLETAGGSTYAVKIPAATNRTYWFEYRQPIGFDSGLSAYPNNGAQVRVTAPFESICSGCDDDTEFLDMTPGTAAFTDGTLVAGSTYIDTLYGISVSVTAATASSLTLDVAALGDATVPDFNFSGTTDLVWRNPTSGEAALWLMNGTTATGSALVLSSTAWTPIALGDFNGDGKTDIVWSNNGTGQTAIWLMDGTATPSSAVVFTGAGWNVTQVGDFNGDGKTDLLWRNGTTGATAVWLMNGLTATSSAVVYTSFYWSVSHVGDFNGDGKTDLAWRNNGTGQTALWLMNGTTATSTATISSDANWTIDRVGDFNGDGKSDLLWRNQVAGQNAIWLMNGTASTSAVTLGSAPGWYVTTLADVNGDGKDDLVWRHPASGQTAVWLMNGTAATANAVVMSDANWTVTHSGDYNGDGKDDLVWRNTSSGATAMWLMNGLTPASSAVIYANPAWWALDLLK